MKTTDKKTTTSEKKLKAPVRLWVKSSFLGFRRSQRNQNMNQALLKIQGVNEKESTQFYLGKRVAYIFKGKSTIKNTKYRAIWGRVTKAHGTNGLLTARFRNNLPAQAIGSTLRVFLYPNRSI